MKIEANTLKGLTVMNQLLHEQNLAMKTNLELRKLKIENSLATMSGLSGGLGAFGQTPITSFNPLLQNNIYAPLTLDWTILMYAYKTHSLIQTMVDMPVIDAMRGGLNVRSKQLGEKNIGQLMDVFERKGAADVICSSTNWMRLFGGGALITATNQPMDKPLDYKQLARDGQVEFYAANRWELVAPWRTSPSFNFYGKTVDASRVKTMVGKEAPYTIRWQLSGWGMSELERAIEDFNTYIRVKNVIYELLYEAKVDVYKFKDFASQMLSAEAEAQTNKRMQITNAQKNYNAAILLDAEDDFLQRQISFSGLAEIYRESRVEISAGCRIPMRKLFGLAATGLSADASGDTDTENYNGMIDSEVRPKMRPVIRHVLDVLCVSMFGDTFDDLDFEFAPLTTVSAKEAEEIKTSTFARVMGLYDRGLIDEVMLSQMLEKEKLIDTDITLREPTPEVTEGDEAALPERKTFGAK